MLIFLREIIKSREWYTNARCCYYQYYYIQDIDLFLSRFLNPFAAMVGYIGMNISRKEV